MAYRAVKKNQALEAISLLEGQLSDRIRYDDPYILYYLVIAYLLHGKIAAAASLMTKSERLFPDFSPMKEVLAYVAVKSGTDREAVLMQVYQFFRDFPESTRLRRLIGQLKKATNFDVFQRNLRLRSCVRIAPPPVRGFSVMRIPRRTFILTSSAVIVIAVAASFFATGLLGPGLLGPGLTVPEEDMQKFRIDTSRYPLVDETVSDKRFTYTSESELLRDYEKARRLIQGGRLNDAVLILNTILMSNANMSVKDRSAFLKEFVANLDQKPYETLNFNLLREDPNLYAGTFVSYTGKAANVVFDNDGSGAFTLLVNEKENRFDGTVEVVADGNGAGITDGDYVTVKGEFLKSGEEPGLILIRADVIENR